MTPDGRRSFLRFIAVGLLNTGVGVATIALASLAFKSDPYVANALGFAVGILVGYQLNRRWTFSSSSSVLITAPRYLLVFGVSYGVNLGALAVLLRIPAVHPMVAQAAAIGSYSIAFYFLCRFAVFPDDR